MDNFEKKNKKLVTFTTGGDPDLETSFEKCREGRFKRGLMITVH